VLAGRQRTVPNDGKVLLLLPGGHGLGPAAFDLDHEQCSMMRYLARAGWNTFTMDFEGHGLSTRPLVLESRVAFPESSAPIHSEVTVHNVERVVEFISTLRGVKRIYLLGHSLGASQEAPHYTIRHPEKVAKLVLFAPAYKNLGSFEGARASANALDTKEKVSYYRPTGELWDQLGSKEELLVPGAFEAYRVAVLASDPKSGELGGMFRAPAGRLVDLLRANPQFDATKITVPTLVIRGALDTFATREDNQLLTREIRSDIKQYVEIPNAGHMIQYEKVNVQFFKAVKDFLEAKLEKKQ
jgi:pimeloyl-ACP methyl ester carboxylesterase